ncbi:MAG TPA: hypothetical protein VJM34_17895 [Novosphingobium sp.]|nr:hypothetical protein [Novosphingobium sp.]
MAQEDFLTSIDAEAPNTRNRGACWAMPGVMLAVALFVLIFASQFTGADPVDAAQAGGTRATDRG